MGFVFFGKSVDKSEPLQEIHTLFFPRLFPITVTKSSGPETVWYVFGNKTHYGGKEDNIYVKMFDLLKFTTQPCVEIHYQDTFKHVLHWKNRNFYDVLGHSWAKTLISSHNNHYTPETTKLVFQPVSIPLAFGYEWYKYPIYMYQPLHWEVNKRRKIFIMKYEREQRSKKSQKLKKMKAEKPNIFASYTVHDDFYVKSTATLDSDRKSTPNELESG